MENFLISRINQYNNFCIIFTRLSQTAMYRRFIQTRTCRYVMQRANVGLCNISLTNNERYPIRSVFFVKKCRSTLEKVNSLQPDIIVLDLEDSILANEKPTIRHLYTTALKDKLFGKSKVFIRCSGLNILKDVQEDIATFTGTGIEGFLVPKIDSANDLLCIDQLITKVEHEKNISHIQTKLIPIIETVSAYFALEEIALASKRTVAMIGGTGDFSANVICEHPSAIFDAFFCKVVLAAKSANILPLWGVHDKIDDHAEFYKLNEKMKRCGFAGTVALTPKQVSLANSIYSMSPTEFQWIERVRNNENNIHLLRPSVQESRQMIGPPHRLKAENMLNQLHKCHEINTNPSITRPAYGLSPDVQIGELIEGPHDCVVTDGMTNIWESAFLQYSSNNTTDNTSNFLSKSVPFALSATLAAAMSVRCFSYHARVNLGFSDIFQTRPIFIGDKLRVLFRIDDVFSKKGGDNNVYAVAKSKHWLVNQDDEVALQLTKVTMFHPNDCSPKVSAMRSKTSLNPQSSFLYNSLVSTTHLPRLTAKPNYPLKGGDIILHDIVKVMGHSEVRMLCYLLKIINPHHHNTQRYAPTDILVPGPFVMAAAISNSSIDIGDVLYEDCPSYMNTNKVNLGDQICTLTFVRKCTPVQSNPQLEEVILQHFAIKNIDVDLIAGLGIPQELFEMEFKKPSEYEKLCIEKMPLLIHKIALVMTRRIIRVRAVANKPTLIPIELM